MIEVGRNRVSQLTLGRQMTIEEHQRHLVLALRQTQSPLLFITNHVQTQHSRVDIQSVDAHRVIVVRQRPSCWLG